MLSLHSKLVRVDQIQSRTRSWPGLVVLPVLSAVSTTSPLRLISHGGENWTSVDSVNKKKLRTAHVVLFRWVSGAVAPVGVLVPLFTPGLGWNVFMSLVTCIIKLTLGHHTGSIPERNIFFHSTSPDQTRIASGGFSNLEVPSLWF